LGQSELAQSIVSVVSVDHLKTFKPVPDDVPMEKLSPRKEVTLLVSSNLFDIIGAIHTV